MDIPIGFPGMQVCRLVFVSMFVIIIINFFGIRLLKVESLIEILLFLLSIISCNTSRFLFFYHMYRKYKFKFIKHKLLIKKQIIILLFFDIFYLHFPQQTIINDQRSSCCCPLFLVNETSDAGDIMAPLRGTNCLPISTLRRCSS